MQKNRRITDPCCSECWHTLENPCPQFVECLLEGPLCHDNPECARLRHNTVWPQSEIPLIHVGAGTCGLGAGANKTIAEIKKHCGEKAREIEIVETGCIGFCSVEPIVDITLADRPRLSFKNVTQQKVSALLEGVFNQTIDTKMALGQYRNKTLQAWDKVPFLDEHPFFAFQTRWVLKNCGIIDPMHIDEYLRCQGYRALAQVLREKTPDEICAIVEESGLRGRGGGGFLTGKKWRLALNTPSDQKYFVCNADEGDPGAFMDRAVIEGDPYRVIEGITIASCAVGASKAYVYIRAEYPLAIRRLKHAIEEAKEIGLLGYNILDSGYNLDIVIKQGAGAFVCGEETALIHSIEGKRGMPRLRPPYPAASGLFGHPTVINNVETLANIPDIILEGPAAFGKLGTDTSRGTKVFALSGKVERTGLVEIEMGKSIEDIVMKIGGGVPNNKNLKAVQIGGPSGGCIPASRMGVRVDYESLREFGAMMGSGGLVVIDEDNCMVDVAKFFMEFIQRESCGKCIPCREGTRHMLEILKSITRTRSHETGGEALERFKGIMKLEELAEVIKDTSLCGLGQTAPNPVLTTLRWFKDEYDAHIYERRCPSGVCTDLLRFEIDKELCRGCTLCVKKCPADAIMGAPKSPHYIVVEKCISCGACVDACAFNAIIQK